MFIFTFFSPRDVTGVKNSLFPAPPVFGSIPIITTSPTSLGEGVDARLVGLGLLYTVSGIEIHLSNRHFSAKCNVKVCSLTAEWLTAHRRIRTTFLDTEQSPAGDSGAVKVNRQRELSSLCVVIGVV